MRLPVDLTKKVKLFTVENAWVLFICIMLFIIIILTTDSSPQWIYQGF